MKFKVLQILTIVYICPTFCYDDDIQIPNHFRWIYHSIASRDLYCPDCCKTDYIKSCVSKYSTFAKERSTECCVKHAKPYWIFDKYSFVIGNLGIDYEPSTGNELITKSNRNENYTYYRIESTWGFLSFIPHNLCEFSNIALLHFTANEIESITDISCLKFLDTLNLSWNRIKSIKSSTFSHLPYLRLLFLSHNSISYLEPETFKYHPRSLTVVDLSYNELVSIDVTNMILGYFFYQIDFSYNQISMVTNNLSWDGSKKNELNGGGFIVLDYNKFTQIPDFYKMGFTAQLVFKLAFNYHLSAIGNYLVCNCLAFEVIYFHAQANVHFDSVRGKFCAAPQQLKDRSLEEFRQNESLLHQLICNITLAERCPPKCYCFNQPSKKRVVVDCSSTERGIMPNVVPNLNKLDIDLSRNIIETFEHRDYLERTFKINLSYNRIAIIDPLIFALENIQLIRIDNNQIRSLVRSVQLRNPCQIWFGNVTLHKCKCDMIWIKHWLDRQKRLNCAETTNYITCEKKNKDVDISLIDEHELCPVVNSHMLYTWLPAATLITLIFRNFDVVLQFRYEVYLIIRNRKQSFGRHKCVRHANFDAYISLNLTNENARNWVIHILDPHLKNLGYNICLPPRDFYVGGIQIEQIYDYVSKTHSFIVIFTEDYLESQFQVAEWDNIWSTFKTDETANIIIINHDMSKSKRVFDRKLKAFMRLGYYLDFSNFNNRLLKDIEMRIGRHDRYR